MARLLRYIHPHVSRYAQVDVPCRQTIIRRNRVELFLTVTLSDFDYNHCKVVFLFSILSKMAMFIKYCVNNSFSI